MLYTFDLHLHSCLSPCGSLENSPSALVAAAKARGLNGIMVADHNTARNAPAAAEACRRAGGIACLSGMEICTAEDVHALAVFDTPAQALDMTAVLYAALPPRKNRPEVFGDQPVVNADDEVEELDDHLLSAPVSLLLPEAAEHVRRLGGLFIACHVDRPRFSALSQLGTLAGCTYFDAAELTPHAKDADWAPRLEGLPVIRSSDAHTLDAVGTQHTRADLPGFSVASLRQWLRARPLSGAPGTQGVKF